MKLQELSARVIHTIVTLVTVGFCIAMVFKVFGPLLAELLEDYANLDWMSLLLWAGCTFSIMYGNYYAVCVCISRWITFAKGGNNESNSR